MSASGGLASLSDEQLLDLWERTDTDIPQPTFEERDKIFPEILRRGLFPESMSAWESEAGLYPEPPGLYVEDESKPCDKPPLFMGDPKFIEKLLSKKEFIDSRQPSFKEQADAGVNPCDPEQEFELSAVQRFNARFLSPQCPYNSALLYHGVGVGKTCAAVTIAEGYLATFPRKKVFIIAPRTIQSGFKRTLFDEEGLLLPSDEDQPNVARGCTGNSYLERTDMLYEKDKAVIVRAVNESIRSRYSIMGYLQFYNYIQNLLSSVPKGHPKETERKNAILRREFAGRMIIIDEAHNLRDTPGETADENMDTPGGDLELSESQAGKKLTPTLMHLLDVAQGTKLVLLSGTPMYNSYKEIIFLMNLLLKNDKKATLCETHVFQRDGTFVPAGKDTPGGEELLGRMAQAYVSFMRGENPLSFPKRLTPKSSDLVKDWPTKTMTGVDIKDEGMRTRMTNLPFVSVRFPETTYDRYEEFVRAAVEKGGTGISSIDEMVQAGNWIFPGEDGGQIRDMGFDGVFEEVMSGQLAQYKLRDPENPWLLASEIADWSPKSELILKKIRTTPGVRFVYSRFIKSGALPLALALEANGYTVHGREKPLFLDGPLDGRGRQCAMCPRRETEHKGVDHVFTPAKYILITGRASLSPSNPAAIAAVRAVSNIDGRQIKVIIGSQVASEGVDFRFVREIFVFDSWFHLNKMEQVLGRGVRTCSHSLIKEKEKRNCLIYLLVNTMGGTETADMMMYRVGMSKAIQVGRVTRVLKRYAVDCNLNREAIIVKGMSSVKMIDAQNNIHNNVDLNDTPMTAVCDWIEGKDGCDYKCIPNLDMKSLTVDYSTYDDYAARWKEASIKRVIKNLFEQKQQPLIQSGDLADIFRTVPKKALAAILSEIINNKSFRLRVKGRDGYLTYKNGFYLFQPFDIIDMNIPLALRVAHVPIKRDSYEYSAAVVEKKVTEVTGIPYWEALKAWVATIEAGTFDEKTMPKKEAPKALNKETLDTIGIPEQLRVETKRRYSVADDVRLELWHYGMILWMYEYMTAPAPPAWLKEAKADVITPEKKAIYCKAFAQAILEFYWDTKLSPSEQQFLAAKGDEKDKFIGREQIVKKGDTVAFRHIDPSSGRLIYQCPTGRCSEAVVRVFETNPDDIVSKLSLNPTTTGAPYGFMVPEAKKATIFFKTNKGPPAAGAAPDEGSKCANISTISVHTRMIKDIGRILEGLGYTKLFFWDRLLEEDEIRRREKKPVGAAAAQYSVPERPDVVRNLIRAARPCTVKELVLRWLDILEGRPERRGKRYFYRPIAALKTGHKGRVGKD